MSVICFTYSEVEEIEKAILKDEDLVEAVQYTDAYRDEERWARLLKDKPFDSAKVAKGAISRACWYFRVANCTAYSLQYRQIKDYFQKDDGDAAPAITDAKTLHQELRSLRCNLATNDGNVFLSKKWSAVLDCLIEAMEARFARLYLDQRTVKAAA